MRNYDVSLLERHSLLSIVWLFFVIFVLPNFPMKDVMIVTVHQLDRFVVELVASHVGSVSFEDFASCECQSLVLDD